MLFKWTNRYCGKQIGQYKIIHRIGQGRYGICFLVKANGQSFILKKLKSRILKKNKAKNCYEAQILSVLRHSSIPQLLGTVEEKKVHGLILEYKCGTTIEDMLFRRKHIFSSEEIFNVGIQLIDILGYLHQKGVVHRDLRIPNVLIHGNLISLVDFGLARWEDDQRYTRDIDHSYLGDFLLYLLYSGYKPEKNKGNRPWYDELVLDSLQRMFLKRLLRLEKPYNSIDEIRPDFIAAFSCKTMKSQKCEEI